MSTSLSHTQPASLLCQLVEGQAFRQLLLGNMRGVGIPMLPDVPSKRRMAGDLKRSMDLLEKIELLHSELGGFDLVSTVRPRMDRVPMPTSRLELSAGLALLGRAEFAAAAGLVESTHAGLATVARDSRASVREEAETQARVFIEACTHPGHREAAQSFWDRWFPIALRSLGRSRVPRSEHAQAVGLRGGTCIDLLRSFIQDAEPMRRACGLNMPPLGQLGVELPEDLRGRFPEGGLHA